MKNAPARMATASGVSVSSGHRSRNGPDRLRPEHGCALTSGIQLGLPATAPSTSTTLVGLTVRLDRDIDRDQPCCENRAVVGSSKGMHHASLTCANCGRFRGWLSAEAVTFICETRDRFASPAEPLVRTPSEETIMAKDARGYDNKPDTGVLFKNTDKTKDTDPDYRGSGKVGGCDYWISGWVNTSQNGTKFMSLKMRPKASAKDRITHADDNLGIG